MLLAGSRQTDTDRQASGQGCRRVDCAAAYRSDSLADPATLCAAKQWETATSRSRRCCTVPCCAVLHRQQHAVTPPRRPLAHMMHGSRCQGLDTTTGHLWSQQHRPAPVTSKPAQQYRRVSASARRPRSGADCRSSVRPATARLPGAEPCCTHPSSERYRSVAHVGHDGATSGHPQRLRHQKDRVGRALSHPIPRFQRFPLLHPITSGPPTDTPQTRKRTVGGRCFCRRRWGAYRAPDLLRLAMMHHGFDEAAANHPRAQHCGARRPGLFRVC